MRRVLLLLTILSSLVVSITSFAQDNNTDSQAWSSTRVEGEIDASDLSILEKPMQYSMEIHYRLKNDMSDFSQLILRPMLGYKLDDTSTIWFGYAYIGSDRNGNFVNEHRTFQMITYSAKIAKTPIVFVGNTRFVAPLSEAGDGTEKKSVIRGIREKWAWAERKWSEVSEDTGIGNPKKASPEKGKRYFEDVTDKVADLLEDLCQAQPGALYR